MLKHSVCPLSSSRIRSNSNLCFVMVAQGYNKCSIQPTVLLFLKVDYLTGEILTHIEQKRHMLPTLRLAILLLKQLRIKYILYSLSDRSLLQRDKRAIRDKRDITLIDLML